MAIDFADSSSSSSDASWSPETNWKIASGSLKKSVTFESSFDSPVDDSADSTRNYDPFVLKPPSSDAGPCEIKLCFSQKHEIRQIYVRSTARVYEIYYAESLQSGNEYLCTVRCSIAERDEEVLQAINVHEFAEECTESSSVQLNQDKVIGDGSNFTCEDDWVEVKVLDSPVVDNKISTLSCKNSANRAGDIQDLYEATAEISDSDPWTSLTIRLLSVQNKGCVCIDEIYVFADPVGSIDSENQALHAEGSAGNSLMAMLVPTILQLSKSGVSQVQGQKTCSNLLGDNITDTLSKSIDSTEVGSEIQQPQNVTLQDVDGTAAAEKIQLADQIINADKPGDPLVKNDSPYDRIEKVLEQLASRVSKIEEVCLRFEENMLKPINSMEMRIQKVEQQLELLAKNSRHSQLPPGTRISAPSFSSESNSSSFHIDGTDYQHCGGPELGKKEVNSTNLLNQSDGISISVDTPNLLPSLVVTVPEFSCDEEEQEDDRTQMLRDSQEKLRRPFIDDVLASALSGFLSTSIAHKSKRELIPATSCDNIEGISNTNPSKNVETLPSKALDITDIASSEVPPKYTLILTVKAPEFTSEENGVELLRTDICQLQEECGQRGPTTLSAEEKEVLEHFLQHQADNGSNYAEIAGSDVDCVSAEGPNKDILQTRPNKDILRTISESFNASSVDFEIPILDVKFASHENSSAETPLHVLLGNVGDLIDEANPVRENGRDVFPEETNFIVVDYNSEKKDPFNTTCLLLDMGICDMVVPSNEESSLDDHPHRACNQDSDASLV